MAKYDSELDVNVVLENLKKGEEQTLYLPAEYLEELGKIPFSVSVPPPNIKLRTKGHLKVIIFPEESPEE